MSIVVDAVYEDGVLKPAGPLPLQEQQKVQITVHTGVTRVRSSSGLLDWKGDAQTVERIALEPEHGLEECP